MEYLLTDGLYSPAMESNEDHRQDARIMTLGTSSPRRPREVEYLISSCGWGTSWQSFPDVYEWYGRASKVVREWV